MTSRQGDTFPAAGDFAGLMHVAYLQPRLDQVKPRWIPATVLLRKLREFGYSGGASQLKALPTSLKQVGRDAVQAAVCRRIAIGTALHQMPNASIRAIIRSNTS